MEDHYYSKKYNRYFPKRLDILLYAHDGRGLGHASRTIAIGMALRKYHPDLRVLFLSGCKESQNLIGSNPLDWMKLPSYETRIEDGVALGMDGHIGYYKSVLGVHRSSMIQSVIEILKPRIVLVDHNPMGKKKELLPGIEASPKDTKWILGVRAVMGSDTTLFSTSVQSLVNKYYEKIYWYGDVHVSGNALVKKLSHHFKKEVMTTGYVSRLKEALPQVAPSKKLISGTISIPWMTQKSQSLLLKIKQSLTEMDASKNLWHFYLPKERIDDIKSQFNLLPHCHIKAVGNSYFTSLIQSKMAIVYGGYNSIMDVLTAGIPSIIILRGIEDTEQEEHIQYLKRDLKDMLMIHPENKLTVSDLTESIQSLIHTQSNHKEMIDINGAKKTAADLAAYF